MRPPLRRCVGGCGRARYTWRDPFECDICTRERLREPVPPGYSIRELQQKRRDEHAARLELERRTDAS